MESKVESNMFYISNKRARFLGLKGVFRNNAKFLDKRGQVVGHKGVTIFIANNANNGGQFLGFKFVFSILGMYLGEQEHLSIMFLGVLGDIGEVVTA